MRVTEKGQVTIPKDIRDKLGISAGSEVEFLDEDGQVRLVKAGPEAAAEQRAQRMRLWIGRVKGSANSGLSTDDIMRMTRDGDAGPD
jgi:antitoxin PrlF